MGVPGLWDKLEQAAQTRSFSEFAITEGYDRGLRYPDGPKSLVVGIDISLWLRQACAVFQHNHHTAGSAPELKVIFYRLARLFRMTTTVIVVYDGDKRPKFKRGKVVGTTPHWLTKSVRQLVELFGFINHTAPGEAEAELAFLNKYGLIQVIVSDDVDTFLFGSCQVIRNANVKKSGDEVQIYSASDIRRKTGLSRGEMILVALLCGGDYDTGGLAKCGIAVSGIAGYGLGAMLLDAALSKSPQALSGFLYGWREELRNALCADYGLCIGRKYKAASFEVTDSFPSREVLHAYTHPLTSWSPGGRGSTSIPVIVAREINLSGLAAFCFHKFEWSSTAIHDKFKSFILSGVCLRMLCQPAPRKQLPHFRPSSVLGVAMRTVMPKTENGIVMYRARVQINSLVAITQAGIESACETDGYIMSDEEVTDVSASTLHKVWIPLSMVREALPLFIQRRDRLATRESLSPSPAITPGVDIQILDLSTEASKSEGGNTGIGDNEDVDVAELGEDDSDDIIDLTEDSDEDVEVEVAHIGWLSGAGTSKLPIDLQK